MPRVPRADFAILGWLSVEPMSGYDLKKKIEGSIAMFWNEGFSSIYPTLRRLSERGLIVESQPAPGDHPSRRVWQATEAGIEELTAWLAEPFAVTHTRNECALKVFSGNTSIRSRSENTFTSTAVSTKKGSPSSPRSTRDYRMKGAKACGTDA